MPAPTPPDPGTDGGSDDTGGTDGGDPQTTGVDGGTVGGTDGGTDSTDSTDSTGGTGGAAGDGSGCGCHSGNDPRSMMLVPLAMLGLAGLHRRR